MTSHTWNTFPINLHLLFRIITPFYTFIYIQIQLLVVVDLYLLLNVVFMIMLRVF